MKRLRQVARCLIVARVVAFTSFFVGCVEPEDNSADNQSENQDQNQSQNAS